MSQIKVRNPIQMIKYIVFHTDWGLKEGSEKEKIIFYYSKNPDISLDQKISDIGLAEAVIRFAQQFGDISEALQCDRMRVIFHQLSSNGIWSTMFVNEAYSVHKSNEDNTQIAEYHDNEICDNFLKLKLKNIYNYFVLLNGPIDELCNKLERQEFLQRCHDFFDGFIPQMELLPINLIELYSSIQYLPLSNKTFMAVQSLLNCIQANDNRIGFYIFIYNDQLVSSSLCLFDTQILYNYLTNIIIPEAVKEEINGISSSKTRWLQLNFPIYLTGERKFFHMCLFRSINGSTIGLLLSEYDENILKECEALLSNRLVGLTNKLHETVTQLAKQSSDSSKLSQDCSGRDVKFIYVNYSNCAQRGNSNCRKLIDSDFTRLIFDVEYDLQNTFHQDDPTQQVFELIGRNMNDAWLITRCSDCRALFTLLNNKNMNVIEASEMIDAMQNRHFTDIFFGI